VSVVVDVTQPPDY